MTYTHLNTHLIFVSYFLDIKKKKKKHFDPINGRGAMRWVVITTFMVRLFPMKINLPDLEEVPIIGRPIVEE
jgi:hypothetical protein